MICEISNPSDRAYIEHESRDAVALAVLMLGGGRYGAHEVGGDFEVPIFLFGGHDEWCERTFGKPLDEWAKTVSKTDLADALDSVRLASSPDHYRLMRRLSGDELDEEHDRNRSSMNDLAGRAWRYAGAIREQLADGAA